MRYLLPSPLYSQRALAEPVFFVAKGQLSAPALNHVRILMRRCPTVHSENRRLVSEGLTTYTEGLPHRELLLDAHPKAPHGIPTPLGKLSAYAWLL